MKLKRLLSVLDVCECTADPELDVRDISFDSRTTQPGDLFAAVCGYESDGHRFIGAAVARGAAVVLCQKKPEVGYTVYPRGRQPSCAVTHLLRIFRQPVA